ncbi:MAG: SH3 domain-containing protein, partial [Lachnospiraceae bacterium]|nr:SH3 domain-containing protein [Lachnospiraceae bacterium]
MAQILYNIVLLKMLKKYVKRAFIVLLCASFFIVNPHFDFFSAICTYALPSSVSIKGTSVNVRSGPGTSYKILGTLQLGYKLNPIEQVKDSSGNGKYWYKFLYNGQSGFVRTDFTKEMSSYVYDAQFETELSRKGFPESYKPGLRDLHANYPNWIFTVHNTGLDFNYVLDNELIGTRTLVNAQSISSYKSTDEGKYDWVNSKWPTFDGNAWVAASREVTAAYLDPRNFL